MPRTYTIDPNELHDIAYYVPHIPNGDDIPGGKGKPGHFYPGIAKASEPGAYYVTDWDWGTDREQAQKFADEMNTKLGLTKEQADQIILRSMFGGKK